MQSLAVVTVLPLKPPDSPETLSLACGCPEVDCAMIGGGRRIPRFRLHCQCYVRAKTTLIILVRCSARSADARVQTRMPGIMSATTALILKQLQPDWKIAPRLA